MEESSYQKKLGIQSLFKSYFQSGNVDAVAEMLQPGKEFYPDINAKFTVNYPVMMALSGNDIEMLNVLFQAGADLDVRDTGGWHFAHELMNKSPKLVKVLGPYVSLGASIDDGTTPLIYAIEEKKWEIVDVLLSLDKPLRVYAQGENGNTAAHLLAKEGKIDLLKALFKFDDAHEAFVENFNGVTPLDLIDDDESKMFIKGLCEESKKKIGLLPNSSYVANNPVPENSLTTEEVKAPVEDKPVRKMGMGGIKKGF